MIGKSVARRIGKKHAEYIVLDGIHQVIVQIAQHNESVAGMIQQQVLFEQLVGFHPPVLLVARIVGIELTVSATFVVVVDGHPIGSGKLELDDQGRAREGIPIGRCFEDVVDGLNLDSTRLVDPGESTDHHPLSMCTS